MSFLLIFHFVLSILGAALIWPFTGASSALSLLAGAALSFLNLVALTMTWSRILGKKQVALAFSVIVFKFAILGWILYNITRVKQLEVGWFSLGMGFVVVSVLATSWKTNRDSQNSAHPQSAKELAQEKNKQGP